MPKLKLFPSNQIVELNSDESILKQLSAANVFIASSCGGFANCTDCIIKIRAGEDNCSSPTYEEIRVLGNIFHLTKERLSCQLKITGDVEIDISRHDALKKEKRTSYQTTKNIIRRQKSPTINEPASTEEEKPKSDQNSGRQGGFNRPKRKF